MPSMKPSTSPTLKPTQHPTTRPSAQPSASPTCKNMAWPLFFVYCEWFLCLFFFFPLEDLKYSKWVFHIVGCFFLQQMKISLSISVHMFLCSDYWFAHICLFIWVSVLCKPFTNRLQQWHKCFVFQEYLYWSISNTVNTQESCEHAF